MFAPALSVSITEAGTQRPIFLDSRLRGNDVGVEFIQTYQDIFVAMAMTEYLTMIPEAGEGCIMSALTRRGL